MKLRGDFRNETIWALLDQIIERFNRTISEEFIVYHRALLRDSVSDFNHTLNDWLHWYNEERPHESLGFLSPLEYHRVHYRSE